jgi:16S rRNA processing protein RimM
MMLAPEAWVPLAEISRPHGVRGEVRLRLYNHDSDLLLSLDEVLVRLSGGEEHEVSVESARRANQAILIKLHSIDDREGAEALRGALVCARRGDFPPLEEGEFYACDVEGSRVVLEAADEASREIGRVRALRTQPGADVLVIDARDGGLPWEVPLVSPLVRTVDVSAGLVTLVTLEGLERG